MESKEEETGSKGFYVIIFVHSNRVACRDWDWDVSSRHRQSKPWSAVGVRGSLRGLGVAPEDQSWFRLVGGRIKTARFARRKRKRVAWAQRANPFWVHEAESSGSGSNIHGFSAHGLTHHSSAQGHSRVVKKKTLDDY